MKTKKLAVLALLTATALIIFVVESLLPTFVPIPGVKLGLSNIITVCVLFLFGRKQALAVLLVRVVLGSILTGQTGALPYSLSGGLLSLLAVGLLRPLFSHRQLWIAGMLGAVFHNVGQMAVAVILTQTVSLLVYLPVLILCGLFTGLFTGLCAQFLWTRLKKIDPTGSGGNS